MEQNSRELGTGGYAVVVETDFIQILNYIKCIPKNSKILIITDDTAGELYLKECKHVLSTYFSWDRIYEYIIRPGEASKALEVVNEIYEFLHGKYFDRCDAVFALGGGVVGDTAGFVAATYLRGINLVHLPTTLLAQVDSSMGGKTGINYLGMKNRIGVFYQPKLVYSNVAFLKTLPQKEMLNGIAEMLVHALIAKPDMISMIISNYENILLRQNLDLLKILVQDNSKIKLSIVEKDEKESGLRRLLNFGHTFGHAIEEYFKYQYSHGECISLGIIAAFKVAAFKGLLSEKEVIHIINLIKALKLPTYLEEIDWKQIMELVKQDKKAEGDKVTFILPTGVGHVVPYEIKLPDDKLQQVVSNMKREKYKE